MRIHKVKVVSKDIFADILAKFQNMFGHNLSSYERMINKAMKQIEDELKSENIDLDWYRYEISQLTTGAMAVMIYGETK